MYIISRPPKGSTVSVVVLQSIYGGESVHPPSSTRACCRPIWRCSPTTFRRPGYHSVRESRRRRAAWHGQPAGATLCNEWIAHVDVGVNCKFARSAVKSVEPAKLLPYRYTTLVSLAACAHWRMRGERRSCGCRKWRGRPERRGGNRAFGFDSRRGADIEAVEASPWCMRPYCEHCMNTGIY